MNNKELSRRSFLLTVGASSLLVACGGGSSSSSSTSIPSPTTPQPPANMKVPLTIDLSQANLPAGAGTVAYAYIIGGLYTDATLTSFKNYRLDASGNVLAIVPPSGGSSGDNTIPANTFPDPNQVVSPADTATINTANYPTDWADYSIPLSVTGPTFIELGNIDPTNIPGLGTGNNAFSMRIYISVGVPKLPFTALPPTTTHVNPYSGPGFDSGSPGALCLFDWFECSIDSGRVLNGNPTYVDQFGMPLIVNAQPGGTPQGELTITREQAQASIAAFDQAVYADLSQSVTAHSAYPAGISYLRAISPDHLSGLPGPLGTATFQHYFDTEIASWDNQSISITDAVSGTYIGGPVSGVWTFTYSTGGSAPDLTPLNYGTITTGNIWQCKGPLASGGTSQQNIGKQILAAFNRGVMALTLDDTNCPAASTFYPSGKVSNLWSQSFHSWSKNGQAYGFAYDDVCGANPSFTTTGALTSLSITLGKML